MNQAAHILLVENDGRLLNERAELLGNFWTMAAVSAFDEAGEQLRAAEMLVLGQTMTEEQRLMWIAASRESAPARPVISVEHGPAARRTGVDAVVDYRQGPAALVSTIYELLNERGLKSKQWAGGGHTLLSPDGLPEIRK
jgi:DNA-binding NtrC family response regulator